MGLSLSLLDREVHWTVIRPIPRSLVFYYAYKEDENEMNKLLVVVGAGEAIIPNRS